MPTTLKNWDNSSKEEWTARLPFILAFCLGERVEFSQQPGDDWLPCMFNRFGMKMKRDDGSMIGQPSYNYRILDKEGVEIDPDAYLESVLAGSRGAPAQGGGGGVSVIQAIVRMFDFSL